MRINTTVALKSLQVQLNRTAEELREAEREKFAWSEKVSQLRNRIQRIRQEIDSLSEKELVVSEHAMLRYFERVLGYDLEEVKSRIINEKIRNQIETVGNSGTFPNDGFRVRLEKGVAVTILD